MASDPAIGFHSGVGMNATVVLWVYCGLIASIPAYLFIQNAVAGGIVSLITAISIAAAASLSREQSRLPRLVNPVVLVGLAGIFLVMLLQIVPMPGGPLINPIWSSAAAAIGEKPTGSITIDTGMTLLVVCRLTGMVAIALLVALIGQFRQHAERLLLVLAGTATLVSLGRITSLFLLPNSFQLVPLAARGTAEIISMYGVIFTAAVAIRGHDRFYSNRSHGHKPTAPVTVEIVAALSALFVNLTAIALGEVPGLSFAALFGAGVLIAILVIRKGRLGGWGYAGTAAVFGLALATFIAFMPGHTENELITGMIEDARLLGAGAGTLLALAPIYGNSSAASDISTVTAVTIEMGRPFLWSIFLITVAWAVILLRDSLQRGRDYVYPATGAGCLAALLISAPLTGGGLSLAPCIILSATLGLAIAQSKGEPSVEPAISARKQSSPAALKSSSSKRYLYGAWAGLGLLLIAQGAWILLPELFRPDPIGFVNDQRQTTISQQDQERATRAAALAGVRGDLWAESAFSYAGLLSTDQAFEIKVDRDQTALASQSLLKTLRYAPHRGDAWLMLASTCEQLKLPVCNIGALLKMSYYTAPHQIGLLPLRLAQALRSQDISSDDELADMVRRDIRFVLTKSADLRPALIAAYRAASSAGKQLVEQTVAPIDRQYLDAARTRLTQ